MWGTTIFKGYVNGTNKIKAFRPYLDVICTLKWCWSGFYIKAKLIFDHFYTRDAYSNMFRHGIPVIRDCFIVIRNSFISLLSLNSLKIDNNTTFNSIWKDRVKDRISFVGVGNALVVVWLVLSQCPCVSGPPHRDPFII